MTLCSNAPLALPDHSAEARQTTQVIRHDGWTQARLAVFLRALASSHSVSAAARAAGMSRQSAYDLRNRSKGEPFDLAWRAAMTCKLDQLAEAAMERALNGVEVPHFHQGELIHTSRKYDERLTVALLAMGNRIGPRRLPSSHPASSYEEDDVGRFIERVERGPDTWREGARQELDRLYEEYGLIEDTEEFDAFDDTDEDENEEQDEI